MLNNKQTNYIYIYIHCTNASHLATMAANIRPRCQCPVRPPDYYSNSRQLWLTHRESTWLYYAVQAIQGGVVCATGGGAPFCARLGVAVVSRSNVSVRDFFLCELHARQTFDR